MKNREIIKTINNFKAIANSRYVNITETNQILKAIRPIKHINDEYNEMYELAIEKADSVETKEEKESILKDFNAWVVDFFSKETDFTFSKVSLNIPNREEYDENFKAAYSFLYDKDLIEDGK